ncbi:nucleotidyl transferase AbiEii/AbiGii toxin family protein [Peptococcaceae bacterium]|nr:nucleotidyl transferase AbiEii/AbiGii toxin family protein [Peptococcaceae bacterium]MCL0052304.1 nucleotidyl transferase AbiEii/AbiGii toxin family protein [Peptococcaceae bacterium]
MFSAQKIFWDVIDYKKRALLKKLIKYIPLTDFYLAGGTALALLLGHRKSFDFDWFSQSKFDTSELLNKLSKLGNTELIEIKKDTLYLFLDNVQLTWLYYPYPLIDPVIKVEGINLASLTDIALMKLIAISQRGERKDFIDLYVILQEKRGTDLELLFELLPLKFPESQINYYHIIKSLTYFEEAETELNMCNSIDWQEVKDFFMQEQKKIINKKINYL